MLIVPIAHNDKIIGIDIDPKEEEKVATLTEAQDGSLIINTTDIGKDIIGYGGPTPIEIYVTDGRISKIKTLPNRETPEFFGAVRNSDLIDSFYGLTLGEAVQAKADALSGATYSSNAVLQNINRGVAFAMQHQGEAAELTKGREPLGWKFYVTLFVVLCGAVIPIILKNRKYRIVQLCLNVLILGLWGGTFISYSLMVSYLTNGITQVALIPIVIMLLTAFIYPMFGKVDHYCSWLCPYGSIQELAGKCLKWKLNISARVAKILNIFRNALWFGLMWLLWTGLWFDWMGYEPFAAFFFKDASPVVLSIAGAFIILSLFVNRPYCRFVCPTGSLFKLSEGRK